MTPVDLLADFYSLVCGQSRCFSIDGQAMPICQRCLGLHVGAGLTFAWLMSTGLRRRGLPPWGVLALHVGLLLAAMAGGLHWIDPGAQWRLFCGLITGHVVMVWILAASAELRQRAVAQADPLAWTRSARFQALLAPVLLAALAAAFPTAAILGMACWNVLLVAGTVSIGVAVGALALAAGMVALARLLRTSP